MKMGPVNYRPTQKLAIDHWHDSYPFGNYSTEDSGSLIGKRPKYIYTSNFQGLDVEWTQSETEVENLHFYMTTAMMASSKILKQLQALPDEIIYVNWHFTMLLMNAVELSDLKPKFYFDSPNVGIVSGFTPSYLYKSVDNDDPKVEFTRAKMHSIILPVWIKIRSIPAINRRLFGVRFLTVDDSDVLLTYTSRITPMTVVKTAAEICEELYTEIDLLGTRTTVSILSNFVVDDFVDFHF